MTATRQRVALVSAAGEDRSALAAYLGGAGFEVHECEELAVPSSFGAVVVLSAPNARPAASDQLLGNIRSWIKVAKLHRIVVVTSRPTAFKDLVAMHGERLHVLPAPAFGWELVDALRSSEPTRPRSA